jgi:hypothetical protein
MVEVAGDSTRDGCWCARPASPDGERIVDADADGLDTDVRGLSLLEAAAVGGETLAVDALANAIGPVFRARRFGRPRRVAMSGGVDSAVALLRAGPRRSASRCGSGSTRGERDRQGVLLSGLGDRRARGLPRARLPHVTLDLREEFRRAVVEPFVRGYARGETPNPCTRCNGGFRFASCSRSPRGRRARLATGHYARIASTAAAACSPRRRRAEGPVVHARARSTRDARPDLVPARRADKDETRAQAAAAGSRPPPERRGEPEACFLAGDDYRPSSLERVASCDARPDRRRARRGPWASIGALAVHPGSAAGWPTSPTAL